MHRHGLLRCLEARYSSAAFVQEEAQTDSKDCTCMQVPWYAVLGNHDYGDGIAPGDPQPRCREADPPWKCSAGPLTQVC